MTPARRRIEGAITAVIRPILVSSRSWRRDRWSECHAKGFSQYEIVPGLRRIRDERIGMSGTEHMETKLGFTIVNRVAAHDTHARFLGLIRSTPQHLTQ